ncbi:MAG: EF-hand domain-containing protein [bacterium]
MPKRRPAKKTETIEVRLAPETKRDFMAACERQKKSASTVIRDFIEAYLARANRASDPTFWKEFDMSRFLKSTRVRIAAIGGCVALGAAIATPSAAADPRLEAFFEWLDTDRDKALTRAEFTAEKDSGRPAFEGIAISISTKGEYRDVKTRAELFDKIDGNGDGKLSLNELARVVTVETTVNGSVLNYDQNGDGRVTEAELAAHVTARRAAAGEKDPEAGVALMARGLIEAHDSDGDGAVGPEDFEG